MDGQLTANVEAEARTYQHCCLADCTDQPDFLYQRSPLDRKKRSGAGGARLPLELLPPHGLSISSLRLKLQLGDDGACEDMMSSLPIDALLGRSPGGLGGQKLRFRPQLFWQEVLPEHAASSQLVNA